MNNLAYLCRSNITPFVVGFSDRSDSLSFDITQKIERVTSNGQNFSALNALKFNE